MFQDSSSNKVVGRSFYITRIFMKVKAIFEEKIMGEEAVS